MEPVKTVLWDSIQTMVHAQLVLPIVRFALQIQLVNFVHQITISMQSSPNVLIPLLQEQQQV